VRVKNRRRGQFRREWALLMPDNTQLQTDFGQIRVRAGETLTLAFIQDIDRDGLVAQEEFLHGSSDFKKDTDDDLLDDFVEVRIGWDVGVVGQPIRHVFSDPATADSDGDGLTDFEESDLQSALGIDPGQFGESAPFSTDPRLRDTDADGVSDKEEVFGYLTGAGIVDATDKSGQAVPVIIAGPDRTADTVACPDKLCKTDTCAADVHCLDGDSLGGKCHCANDGDCLSRSCNQPTPLCDDIQVVEKGTRGLQERTVVVAPRPMGTLHTTPDSKDVKVQSGDGIAETEAQKDDVPVVDETGAVSDAGGCLDRSSFPMCAVVKPGPNGNLDSVPGVDDVLVFGQKIEVTDPLNPDTDMDEIQDGIERLLGSSPNDPE